LSFLNITPDIAPAFLVICKSIERNNMSERNFYTPDEIKPLYGEINPVAI